MPLIKEKAMYTTINLVAGMSLAVALGVFSASAGEFSSKKHQNALAIIPGANQYVFYCAPLTHCGGEQYTKINEDGVEKGVVTFPYGEGNTIKFWQDGQNYRLDHIKKDDGKVTKMTLTPVARKFQPFPDMVLFNSQWGKNGTYVRVVAGQLEYCFNVSLGHVSCGKSAITTIGDRIAISVADNGNKMMLSRYGEDVRFALHRLDNQSFDWPPFKIIDPGTTASLK